jgi:choline-sulfatase
MSEAVCMPARQMLISGLTLFHAWDHHMDVPHLGETLGEDGYDTFFTGKWHNHESALTRAYDTLGPCAVGGMFGSTEVGGAA